MPNVIFDDVGFSVCKSGEVIDRCKWEEVERIVAFKRDHGIHDEICLQIDINGRTYPIELSEEFGDYQKFTNALEQYLTSVRPDWWSKVAFPAFDENAIVVFMRGPEGACGLDR